MDTDFHRKFRFVQVPDDGTHVEFSVRRNSPNVHGGTEIPWEDVRRRMEQSSPHG